MRRRYPEKSNVLLVNITRLGDMLQATPTIAGIKRENPGCKITVVVEKQFQEVCRWIPDIDEVISLDLTYVVKCLHRDGEGVVEAYRYFHEIIEDLRSRKFDYSLNMASSAYTALILSLVGTPRMGGWTADEEGHRRIESDWARLFASSVFHQNRHYTALNLVDVFRLSADVIDHPHNLVLRVSDEARKSAAALVEEFAFTNKGPLIAIQVGASQAKRQWRTEKFVSLIQKLLDDTGARIVLTGTKAELGIIDPIVAAVDSPNVAVAAGRTSIPELAALLEMSDILITGDTGTMHISVAVGTPVISMFLASALGYETGPYAEDSIVIQPFIGCGPCHPGKPCSTIECHDLIPPSVISELTRLRLLGPIDSIPRELSEPASYRIFRTTFDEHGVWDLVSLDPFDLDPASPYREAYRRLWLEDLGGLKTGRRSRPSRRALRTIDGTFSSSGELEELRLCALKGLSLLDELTLAVNDLFGDPERLTEVADKLEGVDQEIERLGYHHSYLGLLVRMFVFSKENLQGSEIVDLSVQMRSVYEDLIRRSELLGGFIVDELRG
jgi:ADP-heptose:LPS heptosyltransferase